MKIRLLLVAALLTSCGGGTAKPDDPSADIVGTPPTPEEDPFFYVARPPVDAKADTRGTIGDAKRRAARERTEEVGDDVETLRRQATLALAARDEAESRNIELRTRIAELENELDEARASLRKKGRTATVTKSDLAQCHSCVKLCPLDGSCSEDAELVCGWGAAKKRTEAMMRATAECNGALQSMREGGAFSRIAGTCPSATCVQ